ncbi:hypothetical protein ALTERO38_80095 [Alteromonas sp. 38]|nr:hypothetical protein ALTER154_10516 [Alteromonas sp. 154]VXC42097.1 hypothetical protein ALTERO38_80095 [Alteromonas sp. 38]
MVFSCHFPMDIALNQQSMLFKQRKPEYRQVVLGKALTL